MNNFYKGGRELAYSKGLSHHAVQKKTTASRQRLQMQALWLATRFLFINPVTLFPKLWKSKAILLFGIALFNMFSLSAQTPRKDSGADGLTIIKPLKIGDTIPEFLWNTPLEVINHPSGKKTMTLNDYRDKKLLVLDFWSTWCSGCLESMSTVGERLKEVNTDKYELIGVNAQKKEQINKATVAMDILKENKISSVHSDSILNKIFEHRSIPHLVWIKDGKLVAQTSHNFLVSSKINQAIYGSVEEWPMKEAQSNYVSKIEDKSLFTVLDYFRTEYALYETHIKTDSMAGVQEILLANHSPMSIMLKAIGRFPMNEINFMINSSRIPTDQIFYTTSTNVIKDDWYAQHANTFIAKIPLHADYTWKAMTYDYISTRYGIDVIVKDTLMDCYTLDTLTSSDEQLVAINGKSFKTLGAMVQFLNRVEGHLPVINLYKIMSTRVNLSLPDELPNDYLELNTYLNPQKLMLKKVSAKIKMIVVTDKGGRHG
ncbi:TlpA family protein disulfide reductase [Sphingobacterium anhuiense]|uniref:TlpA family protein disulfide reductase n=1 Tax=Sphingobacterium anhuiense TaxID=493780 RepID=UPI003C2EB552